MKRQGEWGGDEEELEQTPDGGTLRPNHHMGRHRRWRVQMIPSWNDKTQCIKSFKLVFLPFETSQSCVTPQSSCMNLTFDSVQRKRDDKTRQDSLGANRVHQCRGLLCCWYERANRACRAKIKTDLQVLYKSQGGGGPQADARWFRKSTWFIVKPCHPPQTRRTKRLANIKEETHPHPPFSHFFQNISTHLRVEASTSTVNLIVLHFNLDEGCCMRRQ